MKLTEDLKRKAAEHFKVLKHVDVLLVNTEGKFFLFATRKEKRQDVEAKNLLIITRKDAQDYIGDALYW